MLASQALAAAIRQQRSQQAAIGAGRALCSPAGGKLPSQTENAMLDCCGPAMCCEHNYTSVCTWEMFWWRFYVYDQSVG